MRAYRTMPTPKMIVALGFVAALIFACVFPGTALAQDINYKIGEKVTDNGTEKNTYIFTTDHKTTVKISATPEKEISLYCRYDSTKDQFSISSQNTLISGVFVLAKGQHRLILSTKVNGVYKEPGVPFTLCVEDVTNYVEKVADFDLSLYGGQPSKISSCNVFSFFSFEDADSLGMAGGPILRYWSENDSIISVSDGGQLDSVDKGKGTALIGLLPKKEGRTNLVFENRGGKTWKVPVAVNNPTIVAPKEITIYKGTSCVAPIATCSPEGYGDPPRYGNDKVAQKYTLLYRSSDETVLTNNGWGVRPGTATLTVTCRETNQTKRIKVTVKESPASYIWKGKSSYNVPLGNYLDLSPFVSRKSVPNGAEKRSLSCSTENTDIACASIDWPSDIGVFAKKRGSTVFIIKDSNGVAQKININVVPASYPKPKLTSKQGEAFDNRIVLDLSKAKGLGSGVFDAKKKEDYIDEVEIWRATSKSGKYKRIGSVFADKYIGFAAREFVDKKLRPNKKYWYKIRVHYDVYPEGDWNYTDWGPFSKPVSYWTAPSHKVKFLSGKRGFVRWKKVKGVKGYVVTERCTERAQRRVYLYDKRWRITSGYVTTTKKMVVRNAKWKMSAYDKKRGMKVVGVSPYVKHGKYYYAHGQKVVRSVNKYKGTTYD